MARGTKTNDVMDGQISFDFCLDTRNYVCQANSLIGGKQALKINSAKLIRAAIMQVVRDDTELKPYVVTITELAELLQVPRNNLYRDIDEIANDILSNPVYVREESYGPGGKKVRWIRIPWVTRCEYRSDVGVAIKLNDELKPLLLNLRDHYTQYTLDEILSMNSVYAIRLYELLQSKIMSRGVSKSGASVEMSLDEIRECCGCTGKAYGSYSNLRLRVLDVGVREITQKTFYDVSYTPVKKGRAVSSVVFTIEPKIKF